MLGAEVDCDCRCKLKWLIRGSNQDFEETTDEYELNEYQTDMDTQYTMSYVCNFHYNSNARNYDKYVCEFQFIQV